MSAIPSEPCPVCASECAFYGEQDGYRLLRCEACSVLAVSPMPSDERIAAFYRSYHKTAQYAGKLDSKLRRAKRRIRILRRHTRGRRFLDVGCNAGFATEAARRLGFDALGVDIDPAGIDVARQLFPKARFAEADLAALADGGERYDAIYCSEVVEHLPRPLAFLSALRKCLLPGGRALLTTPDCGHRSLPPHLIGTDMIRPPEHLLYFNRRSAHHALAAAGFAHMRFLTTFKPTLKILCW